MKAGKLIRGLSIIGMLLFVAGCSSAPQPVAQQPVKPVELNVSAALGLKDALLDIQKEFEAKHPDIKLVYNLAASGVLATQIEQGAPADVFISAAYKQINDLQGKGLLLQNTIRPLVGNDLVLIVAKNSQPAVKSFEDLANVKSFGLGAPETVPAGQYGMEVMKKIGIWEQVKDKAVLAKDVRTILAHVETGNTDAGIVFSTVAAVSDKVRIAAKAPAGTHEPIIFPAAILSGTRQPKAANEFMNYLSGPEALRIFAKYGFPAVEKKQ